jgi:septum formation topological specificity factor MinE
MEEATAPPGKEFVFQNGIYLVELTGKKARNLQEFLDTIKVIDPASLFYHLYHSLLEYHFVIPEYYNDFAYWLDSILQEKALAEKIAALNVFQYFDIEKLREEIIRMLEEYIHADNRFSGVKNEAHAFHFKKSITVVLPTKYSARNLREFYECINKVKAEIIFYHFFESRLRLGQEKGIYKDDFSVWIADSLGLVDLAEEIANTDPFGYTLEGIRKELVKIIERYLERDQ